jgi:hypothetical protein
MKRPLSRPPHNWRIHLMISMQGQDLSLRAGWAIGGPDVRPQDSVHRPRCVDRQRIRRPPGDCFPRPLTRAGTDHEVSSITGYVRSSRLGTGSIRSGPSIVGGEEFCLHGGRIAGLMADRSVNPRQKSAFACLPLVYPRLNCGPGKQKAPRRVLFIRLISLWKSGAGEGIRTLDPNLGKVVLYP